MNAQQFIAIEWHKADAYTKAQEVRDLVHAVLPEGERVICRALVEFDARTHRLDPDMPELDAATITVLREVAIFTTRLAKLMTKTA